MFSVVFSSTMILIASYPEVRVGSLPLLIKWLLESLFEFGPELFSFDSLIVVNFDLVSLWDSSWGV